MTARDGIASTLSAMAASNDVTHALAQLVSGCVHAYPATAVAVLVRDGAEHLELLSSSSHEAEGLELLQIQSREGPCVDAIDTGLAVFATGASELEGRWGIVGHAILAAGYSTVHAYPMAWRGTPIGGLNIFLDGEPDADQEIGQMYADLATLAVLQSTELLADHLLARVHEAVLSRTMIEQAKGVVAYQLKVSVADAYTWLLEQAGRADETITATASRVVLSAQRSV
jgi:hypothetical protein